jgi:hypothetical protein
MGRKKLTIHELESRIQFRFFIFRAVGTVAIRVKAVDPGDLQGIRAVCVKSGAFDPEEIMADRFAGMLFGEGEPRDLREMGRILGSAETVARDERGRNTAGHGQVTRPQPGLPLAPA